MELVSKIIPIISGCITIISIVLSVIVTKVKSSKAKNALNTSISVLDAVRQLMVLAEETPYKGELKKEYVKDKLFRFCATNSVEYNEEEVDNLIETMITFSKMVNKNDK